MTFTSADPAQLLARRGWRVRHSAWLLAVILGMGMLSFVGFLYTAFRVGTARFWTAAGAAFAVSAFCFYAVITTPSGDAMADAPPEWQAYALLGLWTGMVVYAVLHNRAYLRWRAQPARARVWYSQPATTGLAPAPGAPGRPAPVGTPRYGPGPYGAGHLGPRTLTAFDVDGSRYYAPVVPPAQVHPSPQGSQPGVTASAVVRVDVNSAAPDQLAAVFGGDVALASRIVAARDARGGFANLDDLATSVRLAPHELVRVRHIVAFGPRTPASRGPGPGTPMPAAPTPGHPEGAGGGRVLDY